MSPRNEISLVRSFDAQYLSKINDQPLHPQKYKPVSSKYLASKFLKNTEYHSSMFYSPAFRCGLREFFTPILIKFYDQWFIPYSKGPQQCQAPKMFCVLCDSVHVIKSADFSTSVSPNQRRLQEYPAPMFMQEISERPLQSSLTVSVHISQLKETPPLILITDKPV